MTSTAHHTLNAPAATDAPHTSPEVIAPSSEASALGADMTSASPPGSRSNGRRLVGIDIARALALIGMFTQHIHIADSEGASSTGWVSWLFEESAGRASVLFFLLSGVSLAMIHRSGSFSATPSVLRRRGFLLLTGGILLTQSVWSASILQHYGLVFLLAPWLLRLKRRGLGFVTAAGLIGGPIAMLWLPRFNDDVLGWWTGGTGGWLIRQAWDLAVSGIYPMVIWIGFFTLGMLIGRTRIELRRTAAAIAIGGVAATLLFGSAARVLTEQDADYGYVDIAATETEPGTSTADIDNLTDAELGTSLQVEQSDIGSEVDKFGSDFYDDATFGSDGPIEWRSLYDTTGHSGAMGWTLQTSGIAAAILGLALLIPSRARRLLHPLAALGSMSLTAYLVHIALVTDVWDAHVTDAGWSVTNQEFAFAGLVATMTLTCMAFHRWLGVGPLEKLLKHFTLRRGDRTSHEGQPH